MIAKPLPPDNYYLSFTILDSGEIAVDAMDSVSSADQQRLNSVPTVHYHYAPTFHYHFSGVAPYSINHGCEYSQFPRFQSQPQESPLIVPEGAICIDNNVIFDPPKKGQMIRMIEVEGVKILWICNKELRDFYNRAACSYLDRLKPSSTDPLLEVSAVLQYIFLSSEPKCQYLSEDLMAAQNEISSYLLEKLRSFEGKEKELGDDITPTGPGPLLRLFLSYALPYLQRFPAEISIGGEIRSVPHLVCDVREWGIRFDLGEAFEQARYIQAPWPKLLPLHNVGIWFPESHHPNTQWVQWHGWFSAPTKGEGGLSDEVLVERMNVCGIS